MLIYRILFGIVAVTAAIILFFFVWGLSDGTASADNMAIWLVFAGAPCAALLAAYHLAAANSRVAASVILALVAVPATLTGLFFLMLIVLAPDWR
ncbi:hypothetical protein FPZ24_01150 [Sphingomonas panacisoli]|uniref:Osmoprotectant transporter permease n=1 Tax=Sphingomonas panacisoli TaxID=1813879 RepID=A0A5B8LEV7_9SPHN|nr:hypothetical protein [Sphingomonas panacisoli]QDZ06252.1 hypothetical protein FPZ24_01150 [Sphingomonas panacisoli]